MKWELLLVPGLVLRSVTLEVTTRHLCHCFEDYCSVGSSLGVKGVEIGQNLAEIVGSSVEESLPLAD